MDGITKLKPRIAVAPPQTSFPSFSLCSPPNGAAIYVAFGSATHSLTRQGAYIYYVINEKDDKVREDGVKSVLNDAEGVGTGVRKIPTFW